MGAADDLARWREDHVVLLRASMHMRAAREGVT
jgi:hypothetical protein